MLRSLSWLLEDVMCFDCFNFSEVELDSPLIFMHSTKFPIDKFWQVFFVGFIAVQTKCRVFFCVITIFMIFPCGVRKIAIIFFHCGQTKNVSSLDTHQEHRKLEIKMIFYVFYLWLCNFFQFFPNSRWFWMRNNDDHHNATHECVCKCLREKLTRKKSPGRRFHRFAYFFAQKNSEKKVENQISRLGNIKWCIFCQNKCLACYKIKYNN